MLCFMDAATFSSGIRSSSATHISDCRSLDKTCLNGVQGFQIPLRRAVFWCEEAIRSPLVLLCQLICLYAASNQAQIRRGWPRWRTCGHQHFHGATFDSWRAHRRSGQTHDGYLSLLLAQRPSTLNQDLDFPLDPRSSLRVISSISDVGQPCCSR
ncbi:hypothetical protein DEU56DRAFT_460073 [Suillus clintonianus]|uniref:uncharacterized protein n=1 Tax=Suillus clintonianus TaxID=1904413 RepID=UPI001B85E209|nr:uncharacterized protein DEU56DRAFT_460073 [Suillus clintonianus]KAG2131034.1 hypothetical protein DEU56DRAFT_460073 [Suillus clintonianus]